MDDKTLKRKTKEELIHDIKFLQNLNKSKDSEIARMRDIAEEELKDQKEELYSVLGITDRDYGWRMSWMIISREIGKLITYKELHKQ